MGGHTFAGMLAQKAWGILWKAAPWGSFGFLIPAWIYEMPVNLKQELIFAANMDLALVIALLHGDLDQALRATLSPFDVKPLSYISGRYGLAFGLWAAAVLAFAKFLTIFQRKGPSGANLPPRWSVARARDALRQMRSG